MMATRQVGPIGGELQQAGVGGGVRIGQITLRYDTRTLAEV